VTNGDEARPPLEVWNELLLLARERQGELGLATRLPKGLRTVPLALAYAMATLSEIIFALCAGHVPWRRHVMWNLTRGSLLLSGTEITQSVEATDRDLGFVPEFSTVEAFEHMLQQWDGGKAARRRK
jgi:hypothetical protein